MRFTTTGNRCPGTPSPDTFQHNLPGELKLYCIKYFPGITLVMHFNDGLPGIFGGIKRLKTSVFNAAGILTHKLSGRVSVEVKEPGEIVFDEILSWESGTNPEMNSKNRYRWTFTESGTIRLEHLRFGRENPVFLVELENTGEEKWETIEPHNCNNDLYSAGLEIQSGGFLLYWNVKGPSENYSMKTIYSGSRNK